MNPVRDNNIMIPKIAKKSIALKTADVRSSQDDLPRLEILQPRFMAFMAIKRQTYFYRHTPDRRNF